MYEALTVLTCLVFKYLTALANRRNKSKTDQALLQLQPYVPPKSEEVETLKQRKKQIQNTMEEFNSPSTFAKYSKMQRELIKLDRQIQQAQKKTQAETQISRKQFEAEQQRKKISIENEANQLKKTQLIVRVIAGIILIKLFSTYYSQPLSLANNWPLNMLSNQQGQINCGWIMLACNLLISFE